MKLPSLIIGDERRRLPVLASVLVLLALGGIGNAFVRHRQSLGISEASAGPSAAVVATSASSSAWYCPGALPIGNRTEASSVAIANIEDRSVAGALVVVDSNGAVSRRAIAIGADSQVVVGLDRSGAARFGAVTVLASGAGIGVEQLVHGTFGAVSAPCVNRTSATYYFPAGSTRGANNLTLAIFDPGATPAVASLSFATSGGTVAPPSFQGIPIGADQLVIVDVGHGLPFKPVVATTLTTTGGRVVAGTLASATSGSTVVYSLMSGLDRSTPNGLLAAGPVGGTARQSFAVFDPTTTAARVVVRVMSKNGAGTFPMSVPPGQVSILSPLAENQPGALGWASVSSSSSTPIVVARTTTILPPTAASLAAAAAAAKTAAKAKTPAVTVLPSLSPGTALSAPVSAPMSSWVLPGGEVDARVDELVTVANPNAYPVEVTPRALGGSPGERLAPFPDKSYRVPANGSISIDTGKLVAKRVALALVVNASGPVVVGEVLYARGSKGSLGLSAPIGIPVG